MQSLNKWLVSICLSIVILLAQVIITQYSMIANLQTELSFARAASRLSSDQVSDMMYELDKLRTEKEAAGTQQFIAGVAAAIERKDELAGIWHDGYNRGMAAQQYADAVENKKNKTVAYTEEKK